MTDTLSVEIPADIKDNSPHTVRIQWRNVRDAEPTELSSARTFAPSFGYTIYEWEDTDKDGTRVTLFRVMNKEGLTVDLFATYYFTRVACTYCDSSWAVVYLQVTDADGIPHPAAPFCGTHADVVRAITRHSPGYSVAQSEYLRIGQHD